MLTSVFCPLFLLLFKVDEVEIEHLFEQFKSLAQQGGIDKATFEKCLGPLGVERNLITDRLFAFFDQGCVCRRSFSLFFFETTYNDYYIQSINATSDKVRRVWGLCLLMLLFFSVSVLSLSFRWEWENRFF
jgi:hypothetical protein